MQRLGNGTVSLMVVKSESRHSLISGAGSRKQVLTPRSDDGFAAPLL
jgi:hypothetical protein